MHGWYEYFTDSELQPVFWSSKVRFCLCLWMIEDDHQWELVSRNLINKSSWGWFLWKIHAISGAMNGSVSRVVEFKSSCFSLVREHCWTADISHTYVVWNWGQKIGGHIIAVVSLSRVVPKVYSHHRNGFNLPTMLCTC